VYVDLICVPEMETVNQELSVFLSEKLELTQEKIAIASGSSVEKKIVIIMGLTPEAIETRLFG
jgi:uncharacterized protein YggU (UPF0235/DUF167 family)